MPATSASDTYRYSPLWLFLAGAISAVFFQQGALAILKAVNYTTFSPFSYNPTAPLGLPQIWSFAFWGGVWGLVFGLAERHFPQNAGYWIAAILFGALLPSLVLWFVVAPIKGQPMAAGYDTYRMGLHLMIHGAWGLGTGILVRAGRT
jgi:hypothetical protein